MTAIACTAPRPLDARSLLKRINPRIVRLRRAIRHDHRDTAFWEALGQTLKQLRSDREDLRFIANLLHVERATARGRIHGTRFATLDEQRDWLEGFVDWTCRRTAALCDLPPDACLEMLRAGEILSDDRTDVRQSW